MFKKVTWLMAVAIVVAGWGWNIVQLNTLNNRLGQLELSLTDLSGRDQGQEKGAGVGESGYEITVDMWHIFEQELQEYKQRIREGRQQYDSQRKGWDSLLSDVKKSTQDHDKYLATEGEFWEKQLKNYEKTMAKSEQRMEIMGQLIDDLRSLVSEFQQLTDARDQYFTGPSIREQEEILEDVEEEEDRGERIRPQIKGGGAQYKTYPLPEERKEIKPMKEEGEVIRGTISGDGKYKTY